MDEHFFIYNGFLFRSGRPVISPDHPSFSFGEGLFETMRMNGGKIINQDLHFERLQNGMKILQFEILPGFFDTLKENILVLSRKNQQRKHARIKISVSRSSNPFTVEKNGIDYVIQSENIEAPVFDKEGCRTLIYKDATKGMGAVANVKSKNFLLNILAYRHAQYHGANDGIILNGHGRICETSIANVYFVEDDKIFTPSLAEGCVAGTIRKWLIGHDSFLPLNILETECSIDRIYAAREVFISNAIKWIQPVQMLNERKYPVKISEDIFRRMEDALL